MMMRTNCLLALLLVLVFCLNTFDAFRIEEATIDDLQAAFKRNELTSRQLVEFYLKKIQESNSMLRGVIEVNPEALVHADMADYARKMNKPGANSALHGITILVKDNIATKDILNTTAGSFALLGSLVPRDAGVVAKLRKAGAIILGKASLSEWASFRSLNAPSGWSARGGQGKNPYVLSATPCGSSSGSAISVTTNMVSISLGTETDGSILCPASFNAVVGIKPTVGLTSRAGVVPVSPRQDTVGPICRTVSDAARVLDAIVGFDYNDAEATRAAEVFIPAGGYTQFLNLHGLRGKRIGIVRNPFFNFSSEVLSRSFESHFQTLREQGAVLIDNVEIADVNTILDANSSGESTVVLAEFKIAINGYLRSLIRSPVRSLADVIAFNNKNSDLEKIEEFGQVIFLAAEQTNGFGNAETEALKRMKTLTEYGFVKMMKDNELDAVVTPGALVSPVLAIGGFPGISVPAAYDNDGLPVGICFSGLKGSEPVLIEIGYAFEQATLARKLPTFLP